MSNPFDYREVMKAHVGYDDRTVDEVIAEQERRHKEAETTSAAKVEAGATKPKQSEVDKLNALMANAKPREPPPSE